MNRFEKLIVSASLLPLVFCSACNSCSNPGAATNCITACASARDPRVACNSCCSAKPGLTALERDACKDACNVQYKPQSATATPPTLPVGTVPDYRVSEIVENESTSPAFSPCSCEWLAPCDSSVTDPFFAEVPGFWENGTFQNFICSLTDAERAALLVSLGEWQSVINSYTQEDFDGYMALLDVTVLEIMANNGVEGDAQYTFYANNLLYGLVGGEYGAL